MDPLFSEERTWMTDSSTVSSDIKTTFNSLLGQCAIRIRGLVEGCSEKGHIYNEFKAFAIILDQTVTELIYGPPQPRLLDAISSTSRTTLAPDYGLHNVLRSSEAQDIMFCGRASSEPTSMAGDRECFVDDVLETLDDQIPWLGNDFPDTPSMYQQTPFSVPETPSRSDLDAFPVEISVDSDILHQRVSDLGSPSRALRKQTSRGSYHASENSIADIRKSKKRASDGEIEPRPKRSKRIAVSNSSAAGVLQNLIRRDQITLPTQYSAVFPSTRLISQSSYFSFQVHEVLDLFKNRLREQERQYIPLLTDLFFAIASPASFRQLFDAMKAMETMKSRETLPVSESRLTIADLVGRLDALDSIAAVHSLLRRFYLLQLFQKRASLMKGMQAERRTLRSGSRKGGEPGKISSLVLTKMTNQAYSSFVGSSKDRSGLLSSRKSLQNRLHAATNWNTLCEEFSAGIIALVPVGRESNIQNQSLEYLPSRPFKIFIEVLKDLRGQRVREVAELLSLRIEAILEGRNGPSALKFEHLDDPDSLLDEPLDSPSLLELCRAA